MSSFQRILFASMTCKEYYWEELLVQMNATGLHVMTFICGGRFNVKPCLNTVAGFCLDCKFYCGQFGGTKNIANIWLFFTLLSPFVSVHCHLIMLFTNDGLVRIRDSIIEFFLLCSPVRLEAIFSF